MPDDGPHLPSECGPFVFGMMDFMRRPLTPHQKRVNKLKRKNPATFSRRHSENHLPAVASMPPQNFMNRMLVRSLLHMAVDAFFPLIYKGIDVQVETEVDAEFIDSKEDTEGSIQ